MKGRTLAAAALSVVAVSSGCGGTSSSGNHSASTSRTVSGASTARAKTVKLAECMRTNGVGAFPDPDASGALTIDAVANGSSLNTNSATFKRALSACKGLEPAGFTGSERTPQKQRAALQFAQCIRDNGVRDFPDPAQSDPLVNTNRIPSAATTGGMTILNAAMRKCSAYASAAGVAGSR